eukprot:SAG31_NODE_678_length_12892_cov_5.458063_8_plen_71_part_00
MRAARWARGAAAGRICCVNSCSGHSGQVHEADPRPQGQLGVAAAATRATRGSGGVGAVDVFEPSRIARPA